MKVKDMRFLALAMGRQGVRDAVCYWEMRRVIYNALLALVWAYCFWQDWPKSITWLRPPALPAFVWMAVAANLCYCAAYAVELAVRFLPRRALWQDWRPIWRMIVFLNGIVVSLMMELFGIGLIAQGPLSN